MDTGTFATHLLHAKPARHDKQLYEVGRHAVEGCCLRRFDMNTGTILFKIITRIKLLFSNYLGRYSEPKMCHK